MTLTNFAYDPLLDLAPWVGQRQATYTFKLINGVTGINKGYINPLRGASLTHDSNSTIKRRLGLALGKTDTELVDPIADRVLVTMVFPSGQSYPLGRYMFTDSSIQRFVNGRLGNMTLADEMFLVDQQLIVGLNAKDKGIAKAIIEALKDLNVTFTIEPTPYEGQQAWTVGTARGQILNALCESGDLLNGWFDNDGILRFIRNFDPATKVPDFDFDTANKVLRASVVETSNVLTAPNRFIVISNAASDSSVAVVGVADVPPTSPNSFANRGFYITETSDLQVATGDQAQVVARNLAIRSTLFEQVNISTAPDPRHDSYNVIRWQGANWLELSWQLPLQEGGAMTHVMKKVYS